MPLQKADKTQQNYDEILILRSSYFLTLPDLDFENRLVNIDHQLLRDTEIGLKHQRKRQVPMVEGSRSKEKAVISSFLISKVLITTT